MNIKNPALFSRGPRSHSGRRGAALPVWGAQALAERGVDRDAPGDPDRFLGTWVTADGAARHELQSNGRYQEARNGQSRRIGGRFWIEGNYIEYRDDSGHAADGVFRDGKLHHAGFVYHRMEA
ncbi:hypothetical protein CEG14_07455 [Bordetella genomosp. 1]|uniref:Uncharacterized protein n=1 Tax=Bordetella genomosp. 1 TaxID=1395607 RepID=A0A261SQR5_9BORD|nr:Atu4866 domain-containing protein [Bordetella genomosp. 1]MDQ8034903.1 Atu4866 domain-containing protein [Bordetella sp.]OZI39347.1 hypothetical protein CEG14_07455 [Bordetella genomosp. 1]OZI65562.1 hypothetical protein CAL27_11080 [Bordetella genomosp. 1]